MPSKIKIIETGIPLNLTNLEEYNKKTLEVAISLNRELGKSAYILQKNTIIDVVENPQDYYGQTLIEPGVMSHRRTTQTKLNKLFTYLITMHRKLNISIVILVGNFNWLDLRIKRHRDIEERLNSEDYRRLGVKIS